MSTREELEAVIWRNWPTRDPIAYRAVDRILAAADAYDRYGPAERDVTAERRAVLEEASAPGRGHTWRRAS